MGATVPPGGAALTRIYDPASGTTTFTVDAGLASHAALSFVACPGARVLDAGGLEVQVVEALGGTTITFPSEEAGTYRVVLAGTAGPQCREAPSACGTPRCSSTRPWSKGQRRDRPVHPITTLPDRAPTRNRRRKSYASLLTPRWR